MELRLYEKLQMHTQLYEEEAPPLCLRLFHEGHVRQNQLQKRKKSSQMQEAWYVHTEYVKSIKLVQCHVKGILFSL